MPAITGPFSNTPPAGAKVVNSEFNVATVFNGNFNLALTMEGVLQSGVTLVTDDLVLLRGQTNKAQNGLYVVVQNPAPPQRVAALDDAAEFAGGCKVLCISGDEINRRYVLRNQPPIVVGTTLLEFDLDSASSATLAAARGNAFDNTAPVAKALS